MSRLSFDQVMNELEGSSNNNSVAISFFSLRNDGDEAIVRIMHDDASSFDMHNTHSVKVNDKYTGYASCLRNSPKDPIENCPLCANKVNLEKKIFIHLIQYIRDESTGAIIPQPKVWVRNVTYARTIASLINEYGPLSDSVFKIKRHGEKGSRETTYDILYCRPDIYNENTYAKNTSFFKDYTVEGTIVSNYSFADLNFYVLNGRLPQKQKEKNEEVKATTSTPVNNTSTNNNAQPNFIDQTMRNPNFSQPIVNNTSDFNQMFSNGVRRYE